MSCEEEEPIVSFDMQCLDDICLVGEWSWTLSTGSIAGDTITPQTEMETRKLIIEFDNYQEFVNDQLTLETSYEFVKSDELSTFTLDSLVLKLDSGNWYAVFGDDTEDELILMEPCADCWTHVYKRN